MRWRHVSLTACSCGVLLLAGCGGSGNATLHELAPLAERVARSGDGCDAQRLLGALIAAVNAGAVPPARQEELISLANAVGTAGCPGRLDDRERALATELAAMLGEGRPLSLLDVLRRIAA